MRWERLGAAFRHPLGRSGIRRSTVLFLGLFIVLAGLLSYHHVTTGPAGGSNANNDCPAQFVVCVPADRASNGAGQPVGNGTNSRGSVTTSTTAAGRS